MSGFARNTTICCAALSLFLGLSSAFSQTDTTEYVGKPGAPAEEKKQEQKKQSPQTFEDRLITGGNFGLSFGTISFIELSPILGYRVSDKFHVGVGIIYNMFRDNRYASTYSSIYGPRGFMRFFIFEQLYALGEYQHLNREYFDGLRISRINVPAMPLGLGYRQFIGDRLGIDLQFMYDVLYSDYSVYGSPLMINTGINYNLGR